jgi:hypothetical protein
VINTSCSIRKIAQFRNSDRIRLILNDEISSHDKSFPVFWSTFWTFGDTPHRYNSTSFSYTKLNRKSKRQIISQPKCKFTLFCSNLHVTRPYKWYIYSVHFYVELSKQKIFAMSFIARFSKFSVNVGFKIQRIHIHLGIKFLFLWSRKFLQKEWKT